MYQPDTPVAGCLSAHRGKALAAAVALLVVACDQKDPDPHVARAISKDPNKADKSVSALPASASPIERILNEKSAKCRVCALEKCSNELTHCSAIAGQAADGPA